MKKHITRKHQEFSEGSFRKFTKSIILGATCAMLTAAILSLIFSATAMAFSDPNEAITAFSLFALIIASFWGGFVALKLNASSALACGLVTGTLLLLVCVFCTFIFPSNTADTGVGSIILFRSAIPIASSAGAYVALSKPKKKRRGKENCEET